MYVHFIDEETDTKVLRDGSRLYSQLATELRPKLRFSNSKSNTKIKWRQMVIIITFMAPWKYYNTIINTFQTLISYHRNIFKAIWLEKDILAVREYSVSTPLAFL